RPCGRSCSAPVFPNPTARQRDGEDAAFSKFRRKAHRAAEPAHQRADVRQANPFARPVLRTRTAKELEYTLMIVRVDAPAIVADLVYHMRPRCMALDFYSAGFPIATILESIVDEIGEDLLHREQVAHNGWKVGDGDGCSLFGGAMRDGLCDRRHDGVHVDLFGLEVAAALAGELEDGVDETIHLGDGGLDEGDRFIEARAQGIRGSAATLASVGVG